MARIKFKNRIYKSGNSYVTTIPASLINDKKIRPNRRYEIIIKTSAK